MATFPIAKTFLANGPIGAPSNKYVKRNFAFFSLSIYFDTSWHLIGVGQRGGY